MNILTVLKERIAKNAHDRTEIGQDILDEIVGIVEGLEKRNEELKNSLWVTQEALRKVKAERDEAVTYAETTPTTESKTATLALQMIELFKKTSEPGKLYAVANSIYSMDEAEK